MEPTSSDSVFFKNYSKSMVLLKSNVIFGGFLNSIKMQTAEAWIYRDDIGAPHGIKGYEE